MIPESEVEGSQMENDYRLLLNDEVKHPQTPKRLFFKQILLQTLISQNIQAEVHLTIVNKDKIQRLNHQYRFKNKPTNVLSFPNVAPPELNDRDFLRFLGDIILCPYIIIEEAMNNGIAVDSHFAHIFIHGILHLIGHDHINDDDAEKMETIEVKLLGQIGIKNPYE